MEGRGGEARQGRRRTGIGEERKGMAAWMAGRKGREGGGRSQTGMLCKVIRYTRFSRLSPVVKPWMYCITVLLMA